MISSHLWSSLAATRFHDTPSTLAFVGIKGIIVVISALGQNRKAYVERGALFIGWAASRVSGVPWAYRYPWWYQWLPDTVPASAMWGSSAARFFRSHSWRGQLRHAYPTLPSLLRFWGNLPPAPLRKGNIQALDLHHSIGLSATPSSLWPGRELRKYHCLEVPEAAYSIFKVRRLRFPFPLGHGPFPWHDCIVLSQKSLWTCSPSHPPS